MALSEVPPAKVEALCLRLAKYKLENKELLTYLLFEADDENSYIASVKSQLDEGFSKLNTTSLFLAKKTIRKVLRNANKYIKYSGQKQTEVEILLYFCHQMNQLPIAWDKSTAMENLFQRQIIKIEKALSTLHEDLQYDYRIEIEEIR